MLPANKFLLLAYQWIHYHVEMKIKLLFWAILIGALGYFVLITPDNPLMRVMRGEISDLDSNVIIGPYPVQSDFEKLKNNGVLKIISLLDPSVPYEKSLLDQEQAIAKDLKMEFANFPMISILGHKMGDDYEKNAAAAADEIAATKGKVYVHCYLGIHRAIVVKNLLEDKNIKIARYLLKEGERDDNAVALDKAEQLYNQGFYTESQNVLESMTSMTPAAKLLYAWAQYHQGDIAGARQQFTAASTLLPDAEDVKIGLAYCDLQENKLVSAMDIFSLTLKSQPENESALTGMGIALYREGKVKESAVYLENALRINPANTEAAAILKRAKSM